MQIVKGKQERPQRVCLYGPEGIGKTTLAACWPSPLYFDLENGTSHLDVDRVQSPTWAMLLGDLTQAAGLSDYKTIIIDTLDAAEKMCIQHVCKKNKKESVEAFGYGKGYTYVMEEFGMLLGTLDSCISAGKNVVVVAHAAMRKFEQPDEAAPYDRWELKLSKKDAPLVKEWCDALLFLNYETIVETSSTGKAKARGGRRIIQVDHHACWDAKNRWGLTGKVPMEFESIAKYIPGNEIASESAPQETAQEQPLDNLTVLKGMLSDGGFAVEMLEKLVVEKGFYPEGTTVEGYSDEFIENTCLGQWENLVPLLEDVKDPVPF